MQKEEQNLADSIRTAGFRATKSRILVLNFFERAKYPLSVRKVVLGLKNKVDQVTVYRMIDAFNSAGVVREVNLRGERPKYELTDAGDDHHHIVCTSCRKVEDFVGCDVERVEKKALNHSRSFSKITGHSFDLYGLCNRCVRA